MWGLVTDRIYRHRWELLVAATALPAVIAAALLQLLGPLGGPASPLELLLLKDALSREPFLAGVMSLVAVLTVHVCICLCGLALAASLLRRSACGRSMARLGLAAGFGVAALVLLLALVRREDGQHSLTIYRVTYDVFRNLYEGTGAAQSLLEPRLLGVDALGWAMLIPTLAGIVGVALIVAAGAAELRDLPPPPVLPDPRYEVALAASQTRLKTSLYLLTLGLVASTVAVSLFFHLPAKLSADALGRDSPALAWDVGAMDDSRLGAATARAALVEKAGAVQQAELGRIRAKLDDYAGELTVFWGAVFTLTLLVAGALPLVLLERRARRYGENSADAKAVAEAQVRLAQSGLLSSGLDQVKLVTAVIAPLASGPVAGLVQTALGS